MKKKIVMTALSALLILGGCAKKEEEKELVKYSNMSFTAGFDTVMSLTGFTETQEEFDDYFHELEKMFLHYNNLFDVYNDYEGINNIKTINDNAGIAPVEVEPAIIDMLNIAREFYELSDGEFDITMGPVLKIWHEYRDKGIELNGESQLGEVPAMADLEEAKGCTGWDLVEINEEDSTVYLNKSCASLDVGGIGKGYAAGKVQQQLIEDGLTHGTVDAGGNIVTINDKPGNQPWRVGIRNPQGNGSLLVLSLPGSSAFVSSGDYERFYAANDGNIYHHIIDPETLFPADHFHQVTVVTQDSGFADALSTALFTMSYEDGLKLIDNFRAAYPDHPLEVMWVMDMDKRPEGIEFTEISGYAVILTEGMDQYIK